ncbi:MAG: PGPGW domain-containing protein [Desulfobacterota bacterium]|nr:PGPGW domain-containing protein [Thermodesulfobacteriota bacterium]MDW8002135.1 PGPGW domain-containing protein [Deltaproteobacteria bacterium]
MHCLRIIRKVTVAFIGTIVLLIGIAMIVLPGPAFVFIPLGLAILASEFPWAKKLLKKLKNRVKRLKIDPEKNKPKEISDLLSSKMEDRVD